MRSTPRERAVGYRVQPPFREAGEAERFEQPALAPEHLVRHQLAQGDHLVAVVGIRDHVAVLAEHVDHRKAVGRKAADAARGLLAPVPRLAVVALLDMVLPPLAVARVKLLALAAAVVCN